MARFSVSLAVLGSFLLSGCLGLSPARKPVRSIDLLSSGPEQSPCQVIFLHGWGGSPKQFQKHGFVKMMKESGVEADARLMNFHLGYARKGNLLERFREDVRAPALREGYEKLWLVGISVGGAFVAALAADAPETTAGVLLLSPYLGKKKLVREIEAAGSLAEWEPDFDQKQARTRSNGSLTFRGIWDHYREGPSYPTYLGYGVDESSVPAQELLSEALPKSHSFAVRGEHDWSTWAAAFADFLESGALQRSCKRP